MTKQVGLVLAFSLLCASNGDAKKPHTEVFIVNQSTSAGFDTLSVTLGPGSFIAPFPPGTPLLTEPALATAFASDFKVRDASGAPVGVGSELEEIDFTTLISKSNWTVVIPGRGTIFGAQKEQVAPLFAIVNDMVARGVFEQTFDPPLVIVTTVPGSGTIIGGTGEFEGAKGTMVETDQLEFISLITGTLTVTDSVAFNFR
jgi:hypothetical protein